jgi:hypothetical protein
MNPSNPTSQVRDRALRRQRRLRLAAVVLGTATVGTFTGMSIVERAGATAAVTSTSTASTTTVTASSSAATATPAAGLSTPTATATPATSSAAATVTGGSGR